MNVPDLLKMDADDINHELRTWPIADLTDPFFFDLLDAFRAGDDLKAHNAKVGLMTIFRRLQAEIRMKEK